MIVAKCPMMRNRWEAGHVLQLTLLASANFGFGGPRTSPTFVDGPQGTRSTRVNLRTAILHMPTHWDEFSGRTLSSSTSVDVSGMNCYRFAWHELMSHWHWHGHQTSWLDKVLLQQAQVVELLYHRWLPLNYPQLS